MSNTKKVNIEISVDTEILEQKLTKFVELLKEAKSLADEIASNELTITIEKKASKENTTTENSDVIQVRGNIDLDKLDYEINDRNSLIVNGLKK